MTGVDYTNVVPLSIPSTGTELDLRAVKGFATTSLLSSPRMLFSLIVGAQPKATVPVSKGQWLKPLGTRQWDMLTLWLTLTSLSPSFSLVVGDGALILSFPHRALVRLWHSFGLGYWQMAKAKPWWKSSPQGPDSFTDIFQRPLTSEPGFTMNASLPSFDGAFLLGTFLETGMAEGRMQLSTIIILIASLLRAERCPLSTVLRRLENTMHRKIHLTYAWLLSITAPPSPHLSPYPLQSEHKKETQCKFGCGFSFSCHHYSTVIQISQELNIVNTAYWSETFLPEELWFGKWIVWR